MQFITKRVFVAVSLVFLGFGYIQLRNVKLQIVQLSDKVQQMTTASTEMKDPQTKSLETVSLRVVKMATSVVQTPLIIGNCLYLNFTDNQGR